MILGLPSCRGPLARAAGFTVLLLWATWCSAQPKDLLIPEGKTVSFPWTVIDGEGFNWDIYGNGNVQQGTNYAYGNGMMLQVRGGQQFYAPNNAGLLRSDGRELQLGPFPSDKIRVWRRIYVDPKLGYARWIDIFENTDAEQPVKLDLQYQNHMGNGVQQCVSTTEQSTPGPKDWGFVTDDRGDGARPAVMHVFASKRSKFRPDVQVQMNNNRILYNTSLTIPPGQTRALCFFEAQRNNFDDAVTLMKTFRPERELARVPKPLRDAIVNMSGDVLLIGRLELPRSRTNDTVVLRDDSEVHGTILNASFPLETFFGKLDLPADRVVGLAVLDPNDGYAQIALTDGQIVGGVLGKDGLKVRLGDGKELTLPPHRLATVGYKISRDRPEEISPAGAMLVLRSGQQLRFDPAALPLDFLTEYGPVSLKPDDLCELRLSGGGRLHQAVFRNGSTLTGLLQTQTVDAPLSLGPKLSIGREMLAGVLYHAPGEPGGPFRLRLRNGDLLLGNLVEKDLPVQTELGRIDVPTERIRTLRRLNGAPGRAAVKLVDETTVSGTLGNPTIRFQIAPDIVLPLYVGHVMKLWHGRAKEKEPNPETKNDATTPPPQPTLNQMEEQKKAKLLAAHRAEDAQKAAEAEKQRKLAEEHTIKNVKTQLEMTKEELLVSLDQAKQFEKMLAEKPGDKDLQAAVKEHVERAAKQKMEIANLEKELAKLTKNPPASQPAQ